MPISLGRSSACRAITAAAASRICNSTSRRYRRTGSLPGSRRPARAPPRLSPRKPTRTSRSRARRLLRSPTRRSSRICSTRSLCRRCLRGRGRSSKPVRAHPSGGRNSMLGKLSWAAVPLDQPIPLVAGCVALGIVGGFVVYVVLRGWAPYLWREWITSVDHKRIGVMYIFLSMVMLLRGFSDAIMMRSQQALAFRAPGYLPPEHYDQIFSAHGTLMILFVAMPFMIGLINIVVPLQLGVRDVAFPTLNSVSFWLTATGALLINLSLVIGEFSRTGWLPYPPLSGIT